jgi:RNA-binding protein Nova
MFNMATESGMDTCPSPEISDSRKRPLDSDAENGTTKRSHYGASKQMIIQNPGYEM